MTTTQIDREARGAEAIKRYDLARMHEDLAVRGYTIIPEAMPRAQAERMGARLVELMARDPEYARKHYFNLHGIFDGVHDREDVELFVPLMDNPVVMALAQRAVGDDFQMSTVGGMRLSPRSRGGYAWHVDVPLGWFAANGRPFPDFTMAITALWMLSDFSQENGATRVVPYSHRTRSSPVDVRLDPDGYGRMEHEVSAEGPAGSCLVFDNAIWHCAGDNQSDRMRLHVTIPYYPLFLDGGNLNWGPVPRRIWQMFPPHVQRMHRHVAEDRT
jgi:ectoine hydroxylase-related dioxygenase (phytanoyl-CoA dioxygenase family)